MALCFKNIFSLFILLVLILMVLPLKVDAGELYIRWIHTDTGDSTIKHGVTLERSTTGTLETYSDYLIFTDTESFFCKDGQYNVQVCTNDHDAYNANYPNSVVPGYTNKYQDNKEVCKTNFAYNENYVWIDNADENLGDFYNENPINDAGTGSCCGDDTFYTYIQSESIDEGFCVGLAFSCTDDACSAYSDDCAYCINHGGSVAEGDIANFDCPEEKECYCNYLVDYTYYVYQDDPDMGEEACKYCMLGYGRPDPDAYGLSSLRKWDDSAPELTRRCCGDDVPGDQELITHGAEVIEWDTDNDCLYGYDTGNGNSYICIEANIDDDDDLEWTWNDSAKQPGQIIDDIQCYPNYQIVSDGEYWYFCNRSAGISPNGYETFYRQDKVLQSNPISITTAANGIHDFICQGGSMDEGGTIYECCGDNEADCVSTTRHHITSPKYAAIINDQGELESWFCSNDGRFFMEGSYDENQFMCEIGQSMEEKFGWYGWWDGDTAGMLGRMCCGDDHNSNHTDPIVDSDNDGWITECINFTNFQGNSNQGALCINYKGKLEDPEAECEIYVIDEGYDCTPLEESQGCIDEDPTYGYDCPNFMPPYGVDDSEKSYWRWEQASDVQGMIYDVTCAGYSIVAGYETENIWVSCTDYFINPDDNKNRDDEIGFDLGSIPIKSAAPSRFVSNPFTIFGESEQRNHDYLCYNYSKVNDTPGTRPFKIAECCNDSVENCSSTYWNPFRSSWETYGGELRYRGDMKYFDGTFYYCKSDYSWDPNLDDDESACDDADDAEWTGGYCCGDLDDTNANNKEYYNDNEYYQDLQGNPPIGACWNSTLIPNNKFVSAYYNDYAANNIYVINGTFHGCAIIEPDILALENCPGNTNPCGGEQLVINYDYGSTIIDTDDDYYYCNAKSGFWEYDPKQQIWHQSSIQPLLDQGYDPSGEDGYPEWYTIIGSCPISPDPECWNGFKCIGEFDIQEGPIQSTSYRCVGGYWVNTTKKFTWDRLDYGYVNDEDCLVDPDGNPIYNNQPEYFDYQRIHTDDYGYLLGKLDFWWSMKDGEGPVSITHDQYIADHYCEHGNWTSRTKFLATQLLDYVINYQNSELGGNYDYTLFCDSFWRALNYYDYPVALYPEGVYQYFSTHCQPEGETEQKSLCANKICVMRYAHAELGEDVIFGISLNAPINQETSFLEALSVNSNFCNDILGDNNKYFQRCGGSYAEIWYNEFYKLVIFGKHGLTNSYFSDETDTWIDTTTVQFIDFISNPIQAIINWFIDRPPVYPNLAGQKSMPFMLNTTRFARLYINEKDDRMIYGIIEKVRLTKRTGTAYAYMTINYTGFDSNICDTVLEYNNNSYWRDFYEEGINVNQEANEINCTKYDSDKYYVISRRPVCDEVNAVKEEGPTDTRNEYYGHYKWIGDDLWDDLTEKLRVQ